MTRRNVFQNINRADAPANERTPAAGYTARGATRSLMNSVGELAEKAAKADELLQSDLIVEIDPAAIDDSFVTDRLPDDEDAKDKELREAIESQGQKSPVRLRVHPDHPARYQIVFGHRRVRVARALGRPVKSVIEALSDIEHVIAQGQENSAREDLSFIERAMFAKQLLDRGFDRETIQAALSVDAPMVTRMLSVATRVPANVVQGIGRAKGVGRDRWQEFAQLIEQLPNRTAVADLVADPVFGQASSDARFEKALNVMKSTKRPQRGAPPKLTTTKWQPRDKTITADVVDSSRSVELKFKSKDAGAFGRYLAANLDELYDQFLKQRNEAE
jgi:ParB family chromosome partitioning protein